MKTKNCTDHEAQPKPKTRNKENNSKAYHNQID